MMLKIISLIVIFLGLSQAQQLRRRDREKLANAQGQGQIIISNPGPAYQPPMRRRDREKLYGASADTRTRGIEGPLTACRFYPVMGRCSNQFPAQGDMYFWSPDQGRCTRYNSGICDTTGKNQFMSWEDCQRACDPSPRFSGANAPSITSGITDVLGNLLPFFGTYPNGYFAYPNRGYYWNRNHWQRRPYNTINQYLYRTYRYPNNNQPQYQIHQYPNQNQYTTRSPYIAYTRSPSNRNLRCQRPDFMPGCSERLRIYFDANENRCKEYTPTFCDRRRSNEFSYMQQCQDACMRNYST